jgi:hypothetical protein
MLVDSIIERNSNNKVCKLQDFFIQSLIFRQGAESDMRIGIVTSHPIYGLPVHGRIHGTGNWDA